MRTFLILLLLSLMPSQVYAVCTDGTNCFCDTVTGPGGSTVKFCEDFEDAAYYENVAHNWASTCTSVDPCDESAHGGSSSTVEPTHRGRGSLWFRNYNLGTSDYWQDGEPNASPRQGPQCDKNSNNTCFGQREWCSAGQGAVVDGGGADCWEGNSLGAPLDIQRAGDVDSDVATLDELTYPGGTGALGGKQWMAMRQTHTNARAGTRGVMRFGSRIADVGLTMLYAFPDNWESSGIFDQAIKFNEWGDVNGSALSGFVSQPQAYQAHFPFQGFITTATEAGCLADLPSIEGSTGRYGSVLGVFTCTDQPRLKWRASNSGDYDHATDWGWEAWGCLRTEVTDIGTSNTCVTQWFGNGMTEIRVIDFCSFDTTSIPNDSSGYSQSTWNFYSNEFGSGGGSENTYRYEDNLVITNGSAVACNDLFENAEPAVPTILDSAGP